MTPPQTAILRTLAYFDVFDYPLTADQVWRWLYPETGQNMDVTLENVRAVLESAVREHKVAFVDSYYCLPGRENIVHIRNRRWQFGQKKWRRARAAARFLEIVPFVRMVAVVNTLAIDNAQAGSDMDFLIITAPHRIWMTRLMVTGIISMLGYRRHGDKIKDRICLSFYATTEAMDFSKLQLQPTDPHFTFWTSQAVPLINDKETYEKYQAANAWVNKLLPNAWSWDWKKRVLKPNKHLRMIKAYFETAFSQPIGDMLEGMARDRQLAKMEKNTKSKAKEGTTEVVISDDMLKFHEDDRRGRYNEKYVSKTKELGLS